MPDDAEPREEIHNGEEAGADAPAPEAGNEAADKEEDAPVADAAPEPPPPPPPSDEVAAALVEKFAGTVFNESHGQPVVYVDRAVWHDVAEYLQGDERFEQCLDVCAVDHLVDNERYVVPGVQPERYEVVANYLSYARNRRIRVITEVPEHDPNVPSIVDLHPGMAFAERETYDMFGITFEGHDDLARILMPDDWEGFPLRKDSAPGRVPVTFKGDPGPR
jgi:NADH:ubiquinone oxidoreductase subunit C